MKPEHTRPFDAASARAGAPYCCRNGESATILKWDGRQCHGYCLIGVIGAEDVPNSWRANGFFGNSVRQENDLVMTPLGEIDGKPVFVGDEIQSKGNNSKSIAQPMSRHFELFRWPAPPVEYPKTTIEGVAFRRIYDDSAYGMNQSLVTVANAALRHAIDEGQVWTPERVLRACEAVKDACMVRSMSIVSHNEIYNHVSPAEIIAKVPE